MVRDPSIVSPSLTGVWCVHFSFLCSLGGHKQTRYRIEVYAAEACTYIVRDLGQQPTTWMGTGCCSTGGNQQRSQQCAEQVLQPGNKTAPSVRCFKTRKRELYEARRRSADSPWEDPSFTPSPTLAVPNPPLSRQLRRSHFALRHAGRGPQPFHPHLLAKAATSPRQSSHISSRGGSPLNHAAPPPAQPGERHYLHAERRRTYDGHDA